MVTGSAVKPAAKAAAGRNKKSAKAGVRAALKRGASSKPGSAKPSSARRARGKTIPRGKKPRPRG